MRRHVLHRWLPAVLALACCLVTAAEVKDRATELHACSGATDVTWQGPRQAALDNWRVFPRENENTAVHELRKASDSH